MLMDPLGFFKDHQGFICQEIRYLACNGNTRETQTGANVIPQTEVGKSELVIP